MTKRPKLDETGIQSELSESAFFRGSRAEQRGNSRDDTSEDSSAAPERDQEAAYAASTSEETRTPVRPSVRNLTRMPFEIYRDQHSALKQFSLDEQARGEKGSMSQMVREALDAYITKRRRQTR